MCGLQILFANFDRTAVDTRALPNYRERTSLVLAKKGGTITQTYIRETPYRSIKAGVPKRIQTRIRDKTIP